MGKSARDTASALFIQTPCALDAALKNRETGVSLIISLASEAQSSLSKKATWALQHGAFASALSPVHCEAFVTATWLNYY